MARYDKSTLSFQFTLKVYLVHTYQSRLSHSLAISLLKCLIKTASHIGGKSSQSICLHATTWLDHGEFTL